MGIPTGMNMAMNNMNMGFGLPGMPNMNMANPMDNEEWLKGFQMGVDEVNETLNAGPKINVIFQLPLVRLLIWFMIMQLLLIKL